MRRAHITLIDGRTLTHALIAGASNAGTGMQLGIKHAQGSDWIDCDDIASIVFDACGACGRAVIEDGITHHGEPHHLDCYIALNRDA